MTKVDEYTAKAFMECLYEGMTAYQVYHDAVEAGYDVEMEQLEKMEQVVFDKLNESN